jgi:hypothetical protein
MRVRLSCCSPKRVRTSFAKKRRPLTFCRKRQGALSAKRARSFRPSTNSSNEKRRVSWRHLPFQSERSGIDFICCDGGCGSEAREAEQRVTTLTERQTLPHAQVTSTTTTTTRTTNAGPEQVPAGNSRGIKTAQLLEPSTAPEAVGVHHVTQPSSAQTTASSTASETGAQYRTYEKSGM